MSTRTAYHWHPESRVFVATSEQLESPLEPGVFYPPGDATFDPPPAVPAGQRAVRNAINTAWVLEPIPAPPAPTPPPEPTPEQQQAALDAAVQRRLDAQAIAWGYASLDRAATYAASTVAKWRTEAQALIAWRDATWQAAYTVQQAVLANARPIPTEAQLMAELPAAPVRPNL